MKIAKRKKFIFIVFYLAFGLVDMTSSMG